VGGNEKILSYAQPFHGKYLSSIIHPLSRGFVFWNFLNDSLALSVQGLLSCFKI